MGWGSGGALMRGIIKSLMGSGAGEFERYKAYGPMIDQFESEDCDTLAECIGTDPAFDRALYDHEVIRYGDADSFSTSPRAMVDPNANGDMDRAFYVGRRALASEAIQHLKFREKATIPHSDVAIESQTTEVRATLEWFEGHMDTANRFLGIDVPEARVERAAFYDTMQAITGDGVTLWIKAEPSSAPASSSVVVRFFHPCNSADFFANPEELAKVLEVVIRVVGGKGSVDLSDQEF